MPLRGLIEALRRDSGPPLFYLLERPFVRIAETVGDDRLSRALPFLAALAVFAAAWALPRGRARAWFAALAAASPFLLLYSEEARAYAPLALLDLAVFLLLFRGRPTPARLAAGTLAAAAALWTHYLAVFFLAVAGTLLIATRRWRAAAALAAAGLLFVPWVLVLLRQPREATAWIHEPVGRSAVMFLGSLGGSARVPLPVGAPLPPALLLIAAGAGVWLSLTIAAAGRHDRELRDAVLVTAGTLVLLLAISLVRPVAVAGRSEMAVLPIWLWAVGRAAPARGGVRMAAAAALLVSLLTSALTIAAARPEAAPNAVARLLEREALASDRVIASTAFYLPLRLAKDRGRLRAGLRGLPADLALHPGWFVPAPGGAGDFEALASDLRSLPAGARVFVVAHPLWAGTELARALPAGATALDLVRRPDAVVVVWSRSPATGRPDGSGIPARDREQRQPKARR